MQVLEFSFILMFWRKKIGRIMKYHVVLSKAVEASPCYFFENWLIKLKWANLFNQLDTIIQENVWSFYPSEPFTLDHFIMRHPVISTPIAYLSADPRFEPSYHIMEKHHQKAIWSLATLLLHWVKTYLQLLTMEPENLDKLANCILILSLSWFESFENISWNH